MGGGVWALEEMAGGLCCREQNAWLRVQGFMRKWTNVLVRNRIATKNNDRIGTKEEAIKRLILAQKTKFCDLQFYPCSIKFVASHRIPVSWCHVEVRALLLLVHHHSSSHFLPCVGHIFQPCSIFRPHLGWPVHPSPILNESCLLASDKKQDYMPCNWNHNTYAMACNLSLGKPLYLILVKYISVFSTHGSNKALRLLSFIQTIIL